MKTILLATLTLLSFSAIADDPKFTDGNEHDPIQVSVTTSLYVPTYDEVVLRDLNGKVRFTFKFGNGGGTYHYTSDAGVDMDKNGISSSTYNNFKIWTKAVNPSCPATISVDRASGSIIQFDLPCDPLN